jgi:hypothetical protein
MPEIFDECPAGAKDPPGFRRFELWSTYSLEVVAQVLGKTVEQVGWYNFGNEYQSKGNQCFLECTGGWWDDNGTVMGDCMRWFWVEGDLKLSEDAQKMGRLDPPPDQEPKHLDDSLKSKCSTLTAPKTAQAKPSTTTVQAPPKHHETPVGKGDVIVVAGDCLSSLAAANGLHWKAVWDYPDNRELKETRKHPNLLLPGDRLRLKEAPKTLPAGAEKVHKFQRVGVPAMLRLRFTLFGEPRKDLKYVVEVDGKNVDRGTLDKDGALACIIAPQAKRARVFLGPRRQCFEFLLGHLPPATEVSGIQARLANLNYYFGPINGFVDHNGEPDTITAKAIETFQEHNQVDLDAEPDEIIAELVKRHGS